MKRLLFLGGFLLSCAVIAPVAMADDHHDKRYYDRQSHDYHVYNKGEDRAYRFYLGEQHRDFREFRRNNRAQQQEYFRWRHEHPDNVIFKLEVR